ncbi:MAG TPA: nodulation protein NfeD [Methylomirabilota bacterium]|jgi:membrane-bound serine protease (ClpP class)
MRRIATLLGLTVMLAAPGIAAAQARVALLPIEGVISPVTVRLIATAIDRAQAEGNQALVIQLDTPGGLERSMRAIVQRMLNAEIPVIVYVAPTGGRAASAGVFITMAAHVAAMAPATNIGAAHPVALGGGVDKESLKKIENDAAAFIRTVALERGRNAEWAEKAVRQSVSITEREAVRLKVVDLVADSMTDLMQKIDGRVVKTTKGSVTLATRTAQVAPITVGFRDRFLNVITDPNVAYVLMMLGMIGLMAELYNPGAIFPGVIGGISIILAFFAFQSLPINYAGLLLILLGIALLIAEIKIVSHGILGIGGVVAMALGSMMLFDAPEIGFRISWWVIVPTVGATAGLFLFVVTAGVRALGQRPMLGAPGLIGQVGRARSRLAPEGQVTVQGEIWSAIADSEPIDEGAPVRIVDVQGLTLKVAKAANPGGAP